jgi:adenylate cyclase
MQSKDLWDEVRNQVRAPLHKLISYAELILEDDSSEHDSPLISELGILLNTCEAILHRSQAAFEEAIVHNLDPRESVVAAIKEHSSGLLTLMPRLHQALMVERSDVLLRDITTICQTIALFEDALVALANYKHIELSVKPESPLVTFRSAAIHNTPDQLIAQIDYRGLLLVVDDDEGNRDVLSRRLLRDGYEVMLAESGKQALRMLHRYDFDLVLLDIMMPEMDGISVLAEIKSNAMLKHLPVVMVTAVDDTDSIVQCIEGGADDYLLKPFNPVILRARVNASLERKRLQDQQQKQRQELEDILESSRRDKERAEEMLLNILPAIVAKELQDSGSVKPMYFEDVTIVFADIVGFTLSTEQLPADELVEMLNEHFTRCDEIVTRYGLEKLKTIGDCYMFAGGIPVRSPSHPVDSVLAAAEMIGAMDDMTRDGKVNWQLRIGINTGPVIAGVVGIRKFAFDIWGDSVNFSSRIEACSAPSRINLSTSTYSRIKDFFACEKRDRVRVKEGKEVEMYFVNGIASGLSGRPNTSTLLAFQTRYETYFRKALATYPHFMFHDNAAPRQSSGTLPGSQEG